MNQPPADTADSYYLAHQKIYPRDVRGRFARLRNIAVLVLLGLFYFMPWLSMAGRQAVLFDLPARKFYIFALVLWPQDFIYLTALLVLAALSLFFFTALAGRLWCGYACPQTVWTEAFLWMERMTEGDRAARMRLDRSPWSASKVMRKGAKQTLWILFALWTGFTFVGYFTPIRTLGAEIFSNSLGPWEIFWILFYGFATYGNAGFLREQVCKYMCPYARFQSAMFDRDTLIITYDAKRGEPRGARRRGTDPAQLGLGDCVDCTWCVQVCPTGIDIRKGLQYECIACAACIDACDAVMDRVGYPRGLVRYTTQHALDGKKTHVMRPRVLIYASLLGVIALALLIAVLTRDPLHLDVIRDRNTLYRMLDNGDAENVYTLKIVNKTQQDHEFAIDVAGSGKLRLTVAGQTHMVRSGEVRAIPVRVARPAYEPQGSENIEFTVRAVDQSDLRARHTARFLAPTQ
ncbi:MAG: cytochrome c oxidase accessory protein CcoG [Steroidobacteraceae bacterium]